MDGREMMSVEELMRLVFVDQASRTLMPLAESPVRVEEDEREKSVPLDHQEQPMILRI